MIFFFNSQIFFSVVVFQQNGCLSFLIVSTIGAQIPLKFLINLWYKLAKPWRLLTLKILLGEGQFKIASIFFRSILNPSFEMTKPKYNNLGFIKVHFFRLINNFSCFNLSRTYLTCLSVGIDVFVDVLASWRWCQLFSLGCRWLGYDKLCMCMCDYNWLIHGWCVSLALACLLAWRLRMEQLFSGFSHRVWSEDGMVLMLMLLLLLSWMVVCCTGLETLLWWWSY